MRDVGWARHGTETRIDASRADWAARLRRRLERPDGDQRLGSAFSIALECAGRCGLDDWAGDLFQELALESCGCATAGFDPASMWERAELLTRQERERRRVKSALERRVAGTGRSVGELAEARKGRRSGVPPLAPRLVAIADLHRDSLRTRTEIRRAAVAIAPQPRVLDDGQFRLFYLAWQVGLDLRGIRHVLELPQSGRRALQRRLRRVSRRLERSLVGGLRSCMDSTEWRWLHAAVVGNDRTRNEGAWSRAISGLARVIHNR